MFIQVTNYNGDMTLVTWFLYMSQSQLHNNVI